MQTRLSKLKGMWSFAMAASAAPIAYLLSAPCGAACGGCPMGGACLLAFPAVMAVVIIVKFSRRVKAALAKAIS